MKRIWPWIVITVLVFNTRVFAKEELSELKEELGEIRQENRLLQEQLDKQKEFTEGLLKKIEVLEKKNALTPAADEQKIKAVVKDALAEKEGEKKLAGLFSEGGLENMIFHGYADLEWLSAEFDRSEGGSRGHNFFDNHHFNLWLGYKMADNLLAKGEVEIEHAGDEWKLEFGDIEWKPFSNDKLELLMGKILVPLGVENPVHASVWNKLISRPLPSISIIPGTYADLGLEARGWFPSYADARFRYHFYVVNGLGDNDGDNIYEQNGLKRSRDNNNNKALGAQLALFAAKGLELGGSAYWGKWDDKDKHDTFILGPHLIYNQGPLELRSEYIFQHIENANGLSSSDANLRGFYFQAAYKLSGLKLHNFLDKWEVASRYDWLNNADGVSSLKQGNVPADKSESRVSAGMIFRPQDWLAFKLEYLYRENKDDPDDNSLAMQAVVNW